ncbi:hypothetical protein PCYB_104260 [Plasmodium cynomolgi strain B]|uniref:Uncharacterized protein n=1 Tax=Plasmodium cynomolgi (strain B) TaxID=1120755 RepID=K6UDR8_PLACD|nr:hypothetical protein PCYB_104260 [Plasmodium cynomolgi strain B]GAB67076.1 hypothetical protein PCYB_104260 [Plasmodium cynomolgi strain B]
MIQIDFSNIKKGKGEKEDECLSKLTAVVDNIEKKAAELDKTNNERNEEFINKCEDLRIYLNSYVEEQKECPKEEFSRVYGIIESVIKESLKKYNNYRKCPSELKEIIKEQIKLGHEIDELFKECKHCENKITKSEEEEPAREEDNSESSQHSQPVNEEKITASGESRDKHTAHDSLETEGVQHSDSSPEDPKRVSVSESDPTESLQGSCSNNPVLCDKLDRRALENNQVSVTDPSVSVSSSSESCTISSLQCALNIPVSTPSFIRLRHLRNYCQLLNNRQLVNLCNLFQVCQVLDIFHLVHKGHVLKKLHLVEKMNVLKQMEFMRIILEVNTLKGDKLKYN